MSSSAGYPGSGTHSATTSGGGATSGAPRGGLDAVLGRCRDTGVARRTQDRWVAGVCTGLGARWGIDPVIARVGFILLTLFGGFGVTLYLLSWLLLPADDGSIALERALRRGEGSAITLLVVTAIVTLNGPLTWMSDSSGFWWFAGVVVAAAAVWSFFRLGRDARQMGVTGQTGAASSAPAGAPGVMPGINPDAPQGGQNAWQQGWQSGPAAGSHAASPAGGAAVSGSSPHAASASPVSPIPPMQDALRQTAPPAGSIYPSSAYGSAQAGTPGSTTLVTAPWATTPAPRPDSSTPGARLISLIVVGAAILAYLGGKAAATAWAVAGHGISATSVGLAASLFVLGVALIGTALARRRPPMLRLMTWLVGLSLLTTFSNAPGAGDIQWRPTTAADLTSYEHGVGTATLDLTGLPVDGTQSVDIEHGVGELRIVLPSNVSAQLTIMDSLGSVDVVGSTGNREIASGQVDGTYTVGSGPVAYDITVDGGVGSITTEIGTSPAPAPQTGTRSSSPASTPTPASPSAPAESASPRSPATTSGATR